MGVQRALVVEGRRCKIDLLAFVGYLVGAGVHGGRNVLNNDAGPVAAYASVVVLHAYLYLVYAVVGVDVSEVEGLVRVQGQGLYARPVGEVHRRRPCVGTGVGERTGLNEHLSFVDCHVWTGVHDGDYVCDLHVRGIGADRAEVVGHSQADGPGEVIGPHVARGGANGVVVLSVAVQVPLVGDYGAV